MENQNKENVDNGVNFNQFASDVTSTESVEKVEDVAQPQQATVQNNPSDRLAPSKPVKAKGKSTFSNPYFIGGATLTVIAAAVLGIVSFAGSKKVDEFQTTQDPMQIQQMQQQQAYSQTQPQSPQQQTAEQANMPALAPVNQPQMQQSAESQAQQYVNQMQQMNNNNAVQPRTEQEIDFGNAQSISFSDDGDIYDPNAKAKDNKDAPKTIKEILASKHLNELTDDQLVMAYQIVDRNRLEADDSLRALRERMAEKNITPPPSVVEQRQQNREMQIVQKLTEQFNEQNSKTLEQLVSAVHTLNKNQIQMKNDVELAIQQISEKIEFDKISAEKARIRYSELTEANKNILSAYSIESIVNNRVWLKQKGSNKVSSFTIGDTIKDGITIETIDGKLNVVHTTKGTIK